MEGLLSVEEVAALLGLHVKTVRGYVRDGRLRAVLVGRRYRIARADVEAFLGGRLGAPEADPPAVVRRVEVSCIVQVDAIARVEADRLTTVVMAAVTGERDGEQVRLHSLYDEDRSGLKLIVVGAPGRTSRVLAMIDALVKEWPR